MLTVRCEACDIMLDEGSMYNGLCTQCKHAVAMMLDMDDDELAFTVEQSNSEDALDQECITLEDAACLTQPPNSD